MKNPQITLASKSPRRADLLRQIGISFEIRPSCVGEEQLDDESPEAYVRRLAQAKASAVQHDALPALGADTVVVHDGRVLEKPRDNQEAIWMLEKLQNDRHTVLTGVSMCNAEHSKTILASALVTFRSIETEELQRYWQTREPVDKAGAYGIQGVGAIFIAGICGQPSTVAGLPLVETNQLLTEFGVDVWQYRLADHPQASNR